MQDLTVSLIQTDLHWQQPDKNRAMLEQLIRPLAGKTDLVVLPEMFTTGFSMAPELSAEPDAAETLTWLQALATEINAAITGSVATRLNQDGEDSFVNRLLFVAPDQQAYYDKRHLFRMGGEHEHYKAGSSRTLISYKGWRILPAICYDLRFPVFLRNRNEYDLLLCVANWPAARRLPWRTLLQARAIENLCFVVGVNRIGSDGNSLNYSGDSMLVDFKGGAMIDAPENAAFVETRVLNAEALEKFRAAFPAYLDADEFELTL